MGNLRDDDPLLTQRIWKVPHVHPDFAVRDRPAASGSAGPADSTGENLNASGLFTAAASGATDSQDHGAQARISPVAAAPSPMQATKSTKPGESPEIRGRPSPAPAGAVPIEPGEFTRVFNLSPHPPQQSALNGNPKSATGVFETASVPGAAGNPAPDQPQAASPGMIPIENSAPGRPAQSAASSTPAEPGGPSEFSQLFKAPAGPYSPPLPQASVPTRIFEAARDEIRTTEAKTPQPFEAGQPGDATNAFKLSAPPGPASRLRPGEKLTPYLGSPVFGGGTLQPQAGVKLSTPARDNPGANSANLDLLVRETPTSPYGATRVFQNRGPCASANTSGESEYTMVVRPSPEKPDDISAPESTAVPEKKETSIHLILTLVLLFLTAVALVLFVVLRR